MADDLDNTPESDSTQAPPDPSVEQATPDQIDQGAEAADKKFGTPPPSNEPEAAPKPKPPADDHTAAFANHIAEQSTESSAAEADRKFGGVKADASVDGASQPGDAPTVKETPTTKTSITSAGKSLLLDILHGTTQLPSEVAGGVLDAVDGATKLLGEVESFASKHLPDQIPVGYNPLTKKFLYGDELKTFADKNKAGDLIAIPDSNTGKMIRGISQFTAGFLATGAAGELAGIAKGAGMIQSVARAAATDFTFFQGQTKNLANLIEEFPVLQNPVTQMLSSHPDDPELVGRLKNAFTGSVAGVLMQGAIEGLNYGVQYLRKAGGTSAFGDLAAKWLGHEVEAPKSVEPIEMTTMGDPNKPSLLPRMQEAEEAAAGIQPSDVKGRITNAPEYEINFAAINTSNDVKQTMRKMAQRESESITEGKGGVQSWEETNAKADQLNAFDVMANRRSGEPLNAAEIVAARRMYVASAEKLRGMAEVASQVPTPANLFNFERMASLHTLVQKEVLNAGSELGRGLQALQIPVGGSEELANQINGILENMGGAAGSLDKANKIVKLAGSAGQAGVDSFVNGTMGKSIKDAIDQAYINGRFGQKTLVVKTVSDFANMFYQMGIRKNAEFISEKLGTEGGVVAGEAAAMAHGAVTAFKESLIALADNAYGAIGESHGIDSFPSIDFKKLLAAPRNSIQQVEGALPFELPPTGKIAAENFGIANDTYLGKALNVVNSGTQVFGRGISLVDQFSKMIGYRMELNAQALRQATGELKGGLIDSDELHERIADLLVNPPENLHLAAVKQATYQTFTAEPAEALKKLGNSIQSFPVVGRMILPFKITPINIMTQAIEGSPLAPLIQSWRADLMAGGARSDIAMSKMATGTALLQLSLDLGMKGIISGKGPEHPGERGNWENLGNQPYSVTLPNGFKLAYNRFEPEGYTLGVGADIAEAIKRADASVDDKDFMKVMVGAVFAISNNVMSKSYLMGMSELMKALTNPEQQGEAYLKRLIGTIPSTVGTSLVSTIQELSDPYARTADGLVDALFRRIPGLSKLLPLQRNIWGETMDRSSELGAAYDAFSPYWLKSKQPSAIDTEMSKLQYYPDMPPHKINFGGTSTPLDGKQYSRYVELAGNAYKDKARGNMGARDYLDALVTGKTDLSAVYDGAKRLDAFDGGTRAKDFIRAEIEGYRKKAQDQLFNEDANLKATADQKKEQATAQNKARAGKLIQE